MHTLKINTLLTITVLLGLILGCKNKQDVIDFKKGTTVITGKIENTNKVSSIVEFTSLGAISEIHKTALVDSLGNFSISFEIYNNQTIMVSYKKGTVQLFMRPNDSLHVVFDNKLFENNNYPTFSVSGSSVSANTTKNLMDYPNYRKEHHFIADCKGKSVKEYLAELEIEIAKADSTLNLFCKNNKTTLEFRNWAKKDVIYGIASYVANYDFFHIMNKTQYEGVLFDTKLFPIDDDSAIVSGSYILYLGNYAGNKFFWKDSIIVKLNNNGRFAEAYTRSLNEIAKHIKPGLSRDIISYHNLIWLFNKSFEDYVVVLKNIDTYVQNPIIKSKLQNKTKQFNKNTLFFNLNTKEEKEILGDFLKILSSEYKDRIVYVDVWATWCGPCRSEFVDAFNLQNYYNEKNIAFVNLCIDSDMSEWKKIIIENNIKGDNYYFDETKSKLIRKKLKVSGLPTYLIINKEGVIIDYKAPRPSTDKEIKKILSNLLKE